MEKGEAAILFTINSVRCEQYQAQENRKAKR
jgi:hypothetical protein